MILTAVAQIYIKIIIILVMMIQFLTVHKGSLKYEYDWKGFNTVLQMLSPEEIEMGHTLSFLGLFLFKVEAKTGVA